MAKAKAKDPFKELKEAPYPLFVAPKPYSFDLNEDMVKLIREEFNAEVVSDKLAEAIKGKAKGEIEKTGNDLFTELGEKWMSSRRDSIDPVGLPAPPVEDEIGRLSTKEHQSLQ